MNSSKDRSNHSAQFYHFLFENNPFPAWIYDIESLKFHEVNSAAIQFYGYSKEEFTSMTFKDIRVNEEVVSTEETPENEHIYKHRKKNGEEVYVEVMANDFNYNDQKARLV